MYKSADALLANMANAAASMSGRTSDLLWRWDIVHSIGNEKNDKVIICTQRQEMRRRAWLQNSTYRGRSARRGNSQLEIVAFAEPEFKLPAAVICRMRQGAIARSGQSC
jgi:hypothetical protein